jgi:hypothetical protein
VISFSHSDVHVIFSTVQIDSCYTFDLPAYSYPLYLKLCPLEVASLFGEEWPATIVSETRDTNAVHNRTTQTRWDQPGAPVLLTPVSPH